MPLTDLPILHKLRQIFPWKQDDTNKRICRVLDAERMRYSVIMQPPVTEVGHKCLLWLGEGWFRKPKTCFGVAVLVKHSQDTMVFANLMVFPGHRGKKLGSILLREALSLIDREGITSLYGIIHKRDLQQAPFVFDWYRRHGFEVYENIDEAPHILERFSLQDKGVVVSNTKDISGLVCLNKLSSGNTP